MTDILEMVDGEEYYNADELDEKALLGDDDEALMHRNIKREETEGDDLYDAAIEPSGVIIEKRESTDGIKSITGNFNNTNVSSTGKRYCCYVGNMTWWTTDVDLQNLVKGCGVNDLVDIKFYENRNNGQSKGFALVVFASEVSVKTIMEKLSTRKLHDQLLLVLPYNKQSLAKFEEATKRSDPKEKKEEKQQPGMVNIGTVRIGHHTHIQQQQQPSQPIASSLGLQLGNNSLGRTNLASAQQLQAAAQVQQQQANQLISHQQPPPPMNTLMNLNFPANANGQLPHGLQHHIQIRQPPSSLPSLMATSQSGIQQTQVRIPGINMSGPPPNMSAPPPTSLMNRPPPGFPQSQQQTQNLGGLNTSAPPPIRTNIPPPGMAPVGGHQPGFPPGAHINPQVYPSFAQNFPGVHMDNNNGNMGISEAEFDEIMNRNRTVSSSAISRAVRDAATGDFGSAIETLVTAISLIRQSRVANDDRCKVLVAALEDTLQGIESKSYTQSSSRKHRSGRDRTRSPSDRSSRKRHRRSSRSRSRERYAYDSPPRHSSTRNSGRY